MHRGLPWSRAHARRGACVCSQAQAPPEKVQLNADMIKVQLTVETIKAPGGAANKPHIKVCVSPLREDAEAAALQKAVDTTLTKALGYATAAKLDSAEVHTNARRPTACGAALRVFISCHVRRRAYDGASAAMPHSEGTSQARNALAASLCPPRRFCKRAPALAERATRRLHLPRRLRQLHRRSAHRHGPSVQHDVRACIAHLSRMLTPATVACSQMPSLLRHGRRPLAVT
jgi:hypothetical protein